VVDVSLHEPHKAQVRAWTPGVAIDRQAWVVLLDPRQGVTFEIVISLDHDQIVSARELRGVQPAITFSEYEECVRLVKSDQRFQEALRRRGVEAVDLVTVEVWGIGTHADEQHRDRRLAWTPCWVRDDPDDNPYAHPIDGLFAIVDLGAMAVLEIEDHGPSPIPPAYGRYRPESTGLPMRSDLRRLEIHQPDGVSFEVDGWEVTWQRWRFRVGFTAREGLVLHQISYRDGGRDRPIIYRASFAELIVPYGDPGPGGYRKCAYDIGEYGIGMYTNSLELGCDCLGQIRYFDVDVCDDHGEPSTIKNAICLHEEDFGLLWKHYDADTRHAEVRRARRLVVSFIITVGNYDYAFYWYLYQDGTIEAEVKATGIVLTQGLAFGGSDYGVVVAPELVAPHHQHFFCARLDVEVDGPRNSLYEVNTTAVAGQSTNPHGNAFRPVATRLERESEAHRSVDPPSGRYWLIVNDGVRNALDQPVAYKLLPGATVLPFAREGSDLMKRAGFLRDNVWVTHYDPRERFPAGDYPNQHRGGAGVPEYQRADRPIVDEDIVLWYAFGMLHISRPEDWPVMPAERIGFMLKPTGFFDRNPSLDVPPPPEREHHPYGRHPASR
jgi:primary-amine oxidase